MGIFSKRSAHKKVIKSFNGRGVNYVTRRVEDSDGVRDEIIGKKGRIVAIDGLVKVICETDDVFCCPEERTVANLLLSGNGVMLEGVNSVTGAEDKIIVYYSKL